MEKILDLSRLLMTVALTGSFISLFGCGTNGISEVSKKTVTIATTRNMSLESSPQDSSFSTLDDLLRFYHKEIFQIDSRSAQLRKLAKSGKEAIIDSVEILNRMFNLKCTDRNKAIIRHVLAHNKTKENFRAFTYLIVDRNIPIAIIDSLFLLFPGSLQNSIDGKILFEKIKKKKDFAEANQYNPRIMDIVFNNTEGKKIALKEVTAKYMLLDFWAYWCSPCRLENRELAKLKDELSTRNDFSIVSISLDNNREKWLKASKEDKIECLNISDLIGMGSPIAKEFKVSLIPSNVLISKDGNIIAHNIWGQDLVNLVKNLP